MAKTKNILICPLDWGLGHATRLVPVIDLLVEKGATVFIGADKRPLSFLKQRFPNLRFIQFPGYSPKYPENGSMALTMIKSFPEMLSESKKAHALLQELIKENEIDIVISDNRYELSSKLAYCVFLTHQLNIQTPGISRIGKPFIHKKINSYIRRFDELWIPDFEGEPNLSGRLSHSSKIPNSKYHFVGPLSRFSLVKPETSSEKPEILVLLSGPEPQRTLLENLLVDQALQLGMETLILQGKPELSETNEIENVKFIPHLQDKQLAGLIKNAGAIICRPGYSTIMDLAVLGKKAILIPTPGQTEQEYLAMVYKKSGLFYSEKQNDFNLKRALLENKNYTDFCLKTETQVLRKRINEILS